MYPDRDTLNNVSRSGYIAARDQSMVESGVTEGGKNTASFHTTRAHNTTMRLELKTTIFEVIPEEKQQLGEEKDADNIGKVHCKLFIQWFWELNLCSYMNRLFWFAPVIGYSFVAVEVKI